MNSSFLVLQGIVGVKLCSAKQFLLFDANVLHHRLPREACKSNLADAIWACGSDCTHEIDGEGFQDVLDGGSLIQLIPWTHGDSFGSIAQKIPLAVVVKR
jgi:hypothetical protein